MKAKDAVYHLVHSLGKAEKRYFKRYTAQNEVNNGSHYRILFDFLLQQDVYDEPAIKKALAGSPIAGHFAESKYQLNKAIIRCLTQFHRGKTARLKVLAYMEEADVLTKKAQAEQAINIIHKAKKLALEYELFGLLIELLEQERAATLFFAGFENSREYLERSAKERLQYIEHLGTIARLTALGDELYFFYLKHGVARKAEDLALLDSIFDNDLLKDIDHSKCVKAKIWFIYCHRTRAFLVQDNLAEHHYGRMYLDLLNTAPFAIKELPARYITAIDTYLNVCFDLKLFDDVPVWLGKLKAIPEKFREADNKLSRLWIFETHSRLLLHFHIYTGSFSEALEQVKEIEDHLPQYADKLAGEGELLLHFAIMIVHLGAKEYSNALTRANVILDDNIKYGREDIVSMTHILRLIIHYELENFVLLPYLVRSVYRHLLKKERLFFAEKAIIRFLKKLTTLKDPADLPLELENLKHTLLEIEEDSVENIALQYFDIISWLESKIEGKDFAQIVSNKTLLKQ